MRRLGMLAMMLVVGAGGMARAADPPDAAALVRSVRAQEAWIDRVESFWIKADVTSNQTPAAIAQRRRDLDRAEPGVDHSRSPHLQPQSENQTELAFDRTRVRIWDHSSGWGQTNLDIWDGRRFATSVTREADPDVNLAMITSQPGSTLHTPLANFASFRAAGHPFWWLRNTARQDANRFDGKPEEFAHAGRERVDDADCDVVCHWGTFTRDYVDRATGRLRAIRTGNEPRPDLKARIFALFRAEEPDFPNEDAFGARYQGLADDKRRAVDLKLSAHMRELTDPFLEFGLEDYREVAPGRWLPMKQTTTIWFLDPQGRNAVETTRLIRVGEVHVAEPLPDDLFRVDLPAGIPVVDETADPPLRYPADPGRTPEGWAALMAQARQQVNPDRRRPGQPRRASPVGRPLPDFPPGVAWLGGPPLARADLLGRVVLLVAWADWSEPSRVDLPALAALGREHAAADLLVLGVHPPEADPAAIARLIGPRAPGFPTLIDAPFPPETTAWGVLAHQLGIDRIPQAILIGRDGQVVAAGPPADLIPRARDLARAPR